MSDDLTKALREVIAQHERRCDEVASILEDECDDDEASPTRSPDASRNAVRELRMAAALLGALRRAMKDRSVREVHDAFGAPGDYGYDTPIGDALMRLYRGER